VLLARLLDYISACFVVLFSNKVCLSDLPSLLEKTNIIYINFLQFKQLLSLHYALLNFSNYNISKLSAFQPGRERLRRVNVFFTLMIIFLLSLLYLCYPIFNGLDIIGVSLARGLLFILLD